MQSISKDIIKQYKNLDTGLVSDVLGRKYVMRASIKAHHLDNFIVVGQAFTVDSMVGCNIASHYALTKAKEDQILVIDAKGFENVSVWGGIQTYYAQKIGLKAVIIDGAVRDISDIRNLSFPVFYKAVTPAGPHKGWKDKVDIPISAGGVPVKPGDLIVGDDDGVVVVPSDMIIDVLKKSKEKKSKEKKWMEKIDKGKNITEAIGLNKKINSLGIE